MNIVSEADNSAYRIKEQEKNKIASKKLTQIEQYKLQKTKSSQDNKESEQEVEKIQNQDRLIQRLEQLNNNTSVSNQINTFSFTQKEDSVELSQEGLDLLKKMQIQSIEAHFEFSQY